MSDDLSTVLSEFARTMVTDFPIQKILDHLVKRIVDIMPVTAAGVTLISPGNEPRYIAASNGAALRFERLQSELDEGPCVAAYRTGDPVAVPDLKRETRFPTFTLARWRPGWRPCPPSPCATVTRVRSERSTSTGRRPAICPRMP